MLFGRKFERFLQILDADIEIFDEPDAVELQNPKGEICFENVSFEYPDDHNKVFQCLNLTIHAGEKLAIVGPSGGGKTTICKQLINSFVDKDVLFVQVEKYFIPYNKRERKIFFSLSKTI